MAGRHRQYWSAVKEVVQRFAADQPFQLAAALSFYLLLSLAPLMLVVVGVAGLVFGEQAARGELVEQIEGTVGRDGAEAVQTVLAHAEQIGGGGLSLIIGVGALLIGATTVFAQLQHSLNQIWNVKANTENRNTIWVLVRTRLQALGIVLFIGLLLLTSLAASGVLAAAQAHLNEWIPGMGPLSQVFDFLATLVVMTVLIALLFKFLPDVKIAWKDVWVGAVITGVLFSIGKGVLGLYLGRAGLSSAYGAAGSLVVLLVWVYYSALILFFGAEVTQVYARRVGSAIQPADYAKSISTDQPSDREQRAAHEGTTGRPRPA